MRIHFFTVSLVWRDTSAEELTEAVRDARLSLSKNSRWMVLSSFDSRKKCTPSTQISRTEKNHRMTDCTHLYSIKGENHRGKTLSSSMHARTTFNKSLTVTVGVSKLHYVGLDYLESKSMKSLLWRASVTEVAACRTLVLLRVRFLATEFPEHILITRLFMALIFHKVV